MKTLLANIFQLLIKLFKELWTVYGGLSLSILYSWLVGFEKNEMDKGASFLILTLTCISVLTFLKLTLFKAKPNSIDKITMQQKSVNALNTAVNPMKKGEELGETIVKTQNFTRKVGKYMLGKIKSFLKWLRNFWQQWNGALITCFKCFIAETTLYMDWLTRLFLPNTSAETTIYLTFKIIVMVVIGLGTILELRNQFTASFIGTNEQAEEYRKKKQNKLTELVDKMSPTLRKSYEKDLSMYEKMYKEVEKKLNKSSKILEQLGNDYNIVIEKFNTTSNPFLQKQAEELYASLSQEKANYEALTQEKNNYDNYIETTKQQLAK